LPTTHQNSAILVQTPTIPPTWALLERELLKAQTAACEKIFAKYFDELGYLKCLPRWKLRLYPELSATQAHSQASRLVRTETAMATRR